ncbi:hypothetical protein FKM82_012928 [Ascaphus truei]
MTASCALKWTSPIWGYFISLVIRPNILDQFSHQVLTDAPCSTVFSKRSQILLIHSEARVVPVSSFLCCILKNIVILPGI